MFQLGSRLCECLLVGVFDRSRTIGFLHLVTAFPGVSVAALFVQSKTSCIAVVGTAEAVFGGRKL